MGGAWHCRQPNERPSVEALLQHPFIDDVDDASGITPSSSGILVMPVPSSGSGAATGTTGPASTATAAAAAMAVAATGGAGAGASPPPALGAARGGLGAAGRAAAGGHVSSLSRSGSYEHLSPMPFLEALVPVSAESATLSAVAMAMAVAPIPAAASSIAAPSSTTTALAMGRAMPTAAAAGPVGLAGAAPTGGMSGGGGGGAVSQRSSGASTAGLRSRSSSASSFVSEGSVAQARRAAKAARAVRVAGPEASSDESGSSGPSADPSAAVQVGDHDLPAPTPASAAAAMTVPAPHHGVYVSVAAAATGSYRASLPTIVEDEPEGGWVPPSPQPPPPIKVRSMRRTNTAPPVSLVASASDASDAAAADADAGGPSPVPLPPPLAIHVASLDAGPGSDHTEPLTLSAAPVVTATIGRRRQTRRRELDAGSSDHSDEAQSPITATPGVGVAPLLAGLAGPSAAAVAELEMKSPVETSAAAATLLVAASLGSSGSGGGVAGPAGTRASGRKPARKAKGSSNLARAASPNSGPGSDEVSPTNAVPTGGLIGLMGGLEVGPGEGPPRRRVKSPSHPVGAPRTFLQQDPGPSSAGPNPSAAAPPRLTEATRATAKSEGDLLPLAGAGAPSRPMNTSVSEGNVHDTASAGSRPDSLMPPTPSDPPRSRSLSTMPLSGVMAAKMASELSLAQSHSSGGSTGSVGSTSSEPAPVRRRRKRDARFHESGAPAPEGPSF
jgi:hypothetical protein